ncbi:MAG: hypothetical protein GXO66_06185 [Euryarchaeota archaeon]|nr:hypothetical protein [Euryarchaeota archaeon]
MRRNFAVIAGYIAENYTRDTRIVEVGVGRNRQVLEELRRRGFEVLGVDLAGGEGVVVDNVLSPRLEVYHGAGLIYSIRPPPELYPALLSVARKAGADLLIRPMSTDPPPEGMRLVNYRGEFFYIKKRSP